MRRHFDVMRLLAFSCLLLAGCSFVPEPLNRKADMLVVGDSVLAWNRGSGQSIPDAIAAHAGISVNSQAIAGAPFMRFPAIPDQYAVGDWTWVLVNGGGNDLRRTCGSDADDAIVDALISVDGTTGAYPDFADRVGADGATLIVLGYYPISISGGPFMPCSDHFDELLVRQERLAATRDDVIFVDAGDVFKSDNLAAYDDDLVHPTPLGGALIGRQIANVIGKE